MKRKSIKRLTNLAAPALLKIAGILSAVFERRSSSSRIAILKIVGMGDTALMLPVIHLLKRSNPNCKITVIVTPITKPLFMGIPEIDEVLVYDILGKDAGIGGLLRMLRLFRSRRFEAFLDFEQNIQITPVIGLVSGAPIRVGLRHPDHDRGRLFTHPVVYDEQERILVLFHKIYLNFCISQGKTPLPFEDLFSYEIPVSDQILETVKRWKSERLQAGEKLIGLHPGSGGTNVFRRWPAENFRTLIRRLLEAGGYRIVLTGSPQELSLLEEVSAGFCPSEVFIANGFKFGEFVGLISVMNCYVSNDTGPLHIGPWVGTPTLGMFGPESPHRYGAFQSNCVSLYHPFPCSPCIQVHLGINPDCTYADKGACVKQITVDEVFQQVVRLAQS